MKVKDVMTRDIEYVHSGDSIKTAAQKMEELNVGVLPVIASDEVFGIITDRDIVVRSTAKGLDPEKHKVMEALSENIVSCNEDDDITAVANLMEEKQIRRVIVKDKDAKVTGIVSLGDLAVNVEKETSGEILKEVSEPAEPAR